MWNCNWGYPFEFGGWLMSHGLFGMAFIVLLLIIILSLVITVIRSLAGNGGENKDTKDSLEILAKKYAHGEITEEEYHRMRDILSG